MRKIYLKKYYISTKAKFLKKKFTFFCICAKKNFFSNFYIHSKNIYSSRKYYINPKQNLLMLLDGKKKVFSYDCWPIFFLILYFFLYSPPFFIQGDFYIIHMHFVSFFLFFLFCGLTISCTLVKKDLTKYLVLIYSLSDLSEEIFRSSFYSVFTFFKKRLWLIVFI